MNRFFLHLALVPTICLLLVPEAPARNFYPLAPGNRWSYHLFVGHTTDSSFVQIAVTGDTLMPNGRTYWHLRRSDILGGEFVRSDSAFVYYYQSRDSSEHRMYNLLSPVGSMDTVGWWYGFQTSQLISIDTVLAFGHKRVARRYAFSGIVAARVTLVDGFGIVTAEDAADGPQDYATFWTLRGCIINGTSYGDPVSVGDPSSKSVAYVLSQNYPNPFNPSTTITIDLPDASSVKLEVVNVLGQTIARLLEGRYPVGRHRAIFDASTLPSGIYIAVLKTPRGSFHGKMMLLR